MRQEKVRSVSRPGLRFAHAILVYAYIPASDDLCTASDILCNQDGYGTSFDRGSFSFAAGQ